MEQAELTQVHFREPENSCKVEKKSPLGDVQSPGDIFKYSRRANEEAAWRAFKARQLELIEENAQEEEEGYSQEWRNNIERRKQLIEMGYEYIEPVDPSDCSQEQKNQLSEEDRRQPEKIDESSTENNDGISIDY